MPIYDLKCPKCGRVEERLVLHTGDTMCHDCHVDMCKLPSRPGTIKVNGFNEENGYAHDQIM